MKEIPLSQGQVAIVDDGDFDWLNRWKWYAAKQPRTFYAVRDVRKNGRKRSIWMHRLINATPKGLVTDHINGIGTDNRRHNLRSATHAENMVNNTNHEPGRYSERRGVTWHVHHGKWVAQITIDGVNRWLGTFAAEDEAADAYTKARAKLRRGQILRE